MHEQRTLINHRGIAGFAIIIAILVVPAYAILSNAPVRPAVVAFMNLEKVFNNVSMREKAEDGLKDLEAKLKAQLNEKTAEVQMLQENADNYEKGSPKYMDAMQASLDAASRMNAFSKFMGYKLDAMMAEQRIQIYDEILLAAIEFAEQHAIDFIIMDDSSIDLQLGTDMQIKQQMTTRRIVYANKALDISDDLTQWINTR